MKEWQQFLQAQSATLGGEAVEKWTKSLKIVDFDAGNLYLEAGDSFQLNWFEEHLRPQIQKYFRNNNGRPIKVHLSLLQEKLSKKKWTPVLNLAPDRLDPACTFENYFPGKTNQVHFSLLKETIEKGSYNPIFLQGPEGCGKTHLLMACAHHLAKKKCFYVKIDTFTHHIVAAIRSGGMQKLRQLYRDHDVLLLDDVHELAHRSATQEELFHTFNALHVAGKQIILAGPTTKIDGIEPRLTSRFEWGLVLPFQPLNGAERKELIDNYPEEIKTFLATAFDSVKLLRIALRMIKSKKELSLESVAQSVAGLLEEQRKRSVTPQAIIKTVAEIFDISSADILGRSQNQECSLPRQIGMYICRNHLKLSFLKIAEIFSRDHSTVMTSVKGVEKKLGEQDNAVLSAMKIIRSKFKF